MLATLFPTARADAAVVSGTIDGLQESSGFYVGDGVSDLLVFWSTYSINGGDGHIYGSNAPWFTDADVYIVAGGIAVNSVSDASVFAYTSENLIFQTGDTVFLRGLNGYYGALHIDDVFPNPAGAQYPYTFLNATWYFQTDGSASFVPLPAAVWLMISGLGVLVTTMRRSRDIVERRSWSPR